MTLVEQVRTLLAEIETETCTRIPYAVSEQPTGIRDVQINLYPDGRDAQVRTFDLTAGLTAKMKVVITEWVKQSG